MSYRPALVLFAAFALSAAAADQPTATLTVDRTFEASGTPGNWDGQLTHAQIRVRSVRMDDQALHILESAEGARSAAVRLNLFDDVSFEANTDLLERLPGGDFTWRGRFDGEGYAILTRRGGETAGIVRAPDGVFEIIPSGRGVSRIAEIHTAALPGCGVTELNVPGNPLVNADLVAAYERAAEAHDAETAARDARGTVLPMLDQIVAFTPNALSSVGGTEPGMFAFIDTAITDFNTVLDNTGIPMHTRVVFKHPLTENETGDAFADRNAFRINGDGKWDEIHQLRDDFGADVAHILVRDSDACGIAAMIYRRGANAADFAFCLTDTSCVSNLTFVHEVGHLIGCAHDIDNAGGINGAGTFPYSFGWHDPDMGPTWHTIMSYSPGAGSSRIPYFSTPDITWSDGNPIGDASLGNNTDTITDNVSLITAWRASVGLAPSTVTAVAQPGVVNLSWSPVNQATGYQVWRGTSTNPLTSAVRAFPDGNTTSYADDTVTPDQTYYYFLKAQFADGGLSPFSDPAQVTAIGGMSADLSGDGMVDGTDLAVLIAAWGSTTADLNGDGTTNGSDLALLLAAWG